MKKTKNNRPVIRSISRRDFIKAGLVSGAAISLAPGIAFADNEKKTDVWVIHGTDKAKMMAKCLEIISANGGLSSKGKEVKNLALKVNSAWARTPEIGANTNPVLVSEFIKLSKASGVKEIVIPENPCDSAKNSFVKSGILEVAKDNGVLMIDLKSHPEDYREVKIPKGKKLTEALVAKQFLDADAVIDMPVAKHHSGAVLSIAMKNWMGAVKDRKSWHWKGLNQCIADFCTFMKPDWAIVDATTIMTTGGPKGPGNLEHPNKIIMSKDQVAADSYATTLFHESAYKVKYLKIAQEMGLGTTEISKMNVHKINV